MRKLIIVSVIIVLAVSAGAYFYIYQPLSRKTALEAVLPADTLAMVRVCDLSGQVERFRSGRMGQALGEIDWLNLLAAMGVAQQERLTAVGAMENAGAAVDSLWFDVLFGQDISLAVLKTGFDPEQLAAGNMVPLWEAVVAVSRPTQPALVLESLGSMFGAQLSAETQTYEQWEINEVTLENGLSLFYALTDGLMITGLSPIPVKTCLRQSLDRQSSLQYAEIYRKHCAELYDADRTSVLAFADTRSLFPLLREAMAEDATADAGIKQLEKIEGFESLNFVQYNDGGEQVVSRMIVGLDRDNMSPYLARMLATAPEPNATFERMPADALLYGWQNTFDLNLYWENLQQDPAMTPEILSQIKQTVLEKTGVDLETLLGAFGTQAGLLVNDIDTEGLFPIPELALFVEVVRPEVVDQLLRYQVAQTGLPVQQERYKETDLRYVSLPLGGSLSPTYAFSDGFCTLATSRTLLKALLDAPESGSLKTHPHVLALGDYVTSESNSVFYIRADGLIEKTRDLLSLALSWVSMTNPNTNTGDIMSQGLSPLLDGLSMVEAAGGRTVVEEDRVVSEVKVLLDRDQSGRR